MLPMIVGMCVTMVCVVVNVAPPTVGQLAGAFDVFVGECVLRFAPGYDLASEQQRLREVAADEGDVVEDGNDRAAFVVPNADRGHQVVGGAFVNSGEGF